MSKLFDIAASTEDIEIELEKVSNLMGLLDEEVFENVIAKRHPRYNIQMSLFHVVWDVIIAQVEAIHIIKETLYEESSKDKSATKEDGDIA